MEEEQLLILSTSSANNHYQASTCTKSSHVNKQEALLSQRGRAMLRVCIASIQHVERSLLLLVVLASDIPLRTIKFFSVLFSSAYSSMLQAITNIRWCVADCAIYTAWSSVTVFVTSQFARPAIHRQPVVRGRLCHILSFVVGKCFWHFTHPAIFDSQWIGTNLIHDFTALTFSVKLAFFLEKCPFPCFHEIRIFS